MSTHFKTAAVFPGQGVPARAICDVLVQGDPHPLLDALAAALGTRQWTTLRFDDTCVSSPCSFVAGYLNASSRWAQERPGIVAGHSLGEITALAFAGAVDPLDGLSLVLRRAEVCSHANAERPGGMATVMGITVPAIEWARRLASARTSATVEIAAVNGAAQVTLSGDDSALNEAIRISAELGAAVARLPIGGAYHSPLMSGAVEEYAAAVAATDVREPRARFISAIDLAWHDDPDSIREVLVRALLVPVQWRLACQLMRDDGVELVIESGPGETLRKLGRRDGVVRFG